jgi:ribosome-associated translation inhibitor RaiA
LSDDLKDILNNSNKDIDNQQLMDYLSQHINKANEHDVEKAMADDAFVNDAVEGLQQMQGSKNITAYVEQLNDDLQKQIAKNKQRKEKRRLKDSPYTYFTIIILLVLMVICFVVVKKYIDSKRKALPATSYITLAQMPETNPG